MKESTDIVRYEAASAKRQKILDYLHERAEPATASAIAAATWIPKINLLAILRKMSIALEVKKTDRKMTAPWIALVRITRSGEELMQSTHERSTTFAKESRENLEREAAPDRYIRGRLIHKVGNNAPPLKNQGGQGASKPRRSSCMA